MNMIKKRENEWIGTNLPIKIQRSPLSRLRMAMDLIFNSMACMVWQVDASHLISSHPIPLRLQPSFFPFSVAFWLNDRILKDIWANGQTEISIIRRPQDTEMRESETSAPMLKMTTPSSSLCLQHLSSGLCVCHVCMNAHFHLGKRKSDSTMVHTLQIRSR